MISKAIFAGALHLSHRRMLWLLFLLALFVGGRTADPWLLLAAGLWGVARLAVVAAFPRVRLSLRLTRPAVFAHEWVRATGRIANPSLWPIPWVEIESRQPDALVGGLRRVAWLPGGAVRTLEVAWYASTRGVYGLGRFVLRGGDWFGLQSVTRETVPFREVVVYPAVRAVSLAPEVRRLPEGPRPDRGSPFLDDLPAGVRPYRGGDAQRDIAWRASAHHGFLLVREFPRVRESATCLLLDLDARAWHGPAAEGMERAISLCASLVCDARLAGRPLAFGAFAGLRAHAASGEPHDEPAQAIWSAPRPGEAGRRALLRLLAAAQPGEAPDFCLLLRRLEPRVPWGAQAVWIVPRDTAEIRARAAMWRAHGHPVHVLCVQRREGSPVERAGGTRIWEVWGDAEFVLR